MKKFYLTALACLAASTSVLACSNVFIAGKHGAAAVARTMDLVFNIGNTFGYGPKGEHNTSHINIPQKNLNPLSWKTKYAYMGQVAFGTSIVVDGMNTQGLYAAYLDLPGISDYPAFNPKDKRPELGITDLTNYVLGTAKNVKQAVKALKKTQMVANALAIKTPQGTQFVDNDIHFVMRDKRGNSAVIEWINNHGHVDTNYYIHKAGSRLVKETSYGNKTCVYVIRNTQGAVLTNSPQYRWQLKNARRYNHVFDGNTDQQWDGQYMNGSGMVGLPGDWTPPSRFVRATQIVRQMPTPTTETQALFMAHNVLQTMIAPVGGNPSPSIWESLIDLRNGVYYYHPIITINENPKTHVLDGTVEKMDVAWQKYNMHQLAQQNTVPKHWVDATVKPGPMVPESQVGNLRKAYAAPTPAGFKQKIVFTN